MRHSGKRSGRAVLAAATAALFGLLTAVLLTAGSGSAAAACRL